MGSERWEGLGHIGPSWPWSRLRILSSAMERQCGRLNNDPQRYPHSSRWNLKLVIGYDRHRLCRCDYVKDLEMGILSWIMQVSPKCHRMYPCKEGGRERE